MITATITYGDSRLSIKPAMVITRGLINHVEILLQATGTLGFTDVLRWELIVTKNYDTTTQNILCAATTVAFENNILTATINANTYELSSYIGARDTTVAVVTIRGIGVNGAIVRAYTCLATVANVGYAGGDFTTTAVADMVYTRARLDAILDTFMSDLGTPESIAVKEDVANKTQEIDAVTPSADKYTSEAAVVAHVAGLIPDVPGDISELTDTTGILAGKVDADGDKVLSDNNYTNTDAAKVATINNATLETLSGADVTVAPWGRYRWSASGVCSITLAGFAALGEEVAKIIITVATGATLSLPAGTVVEEGDVVDAAGVYETYIRVIDSVVYFRVISRPEAA